MIKESTMENQSLTSNWEYGTLEDAVNKGSSNISLNKVKEDDGEYKLYSAKGYNKNISFFHQEKEYLAIIKDGAGIGRVSKHPAKSSVVATMQYLIPKEGFDIGFVQYFLNGIDFESHRQGSTIPHVYFKDYKSELFPLLPLPQQKQIVAILDQAFAAIDTAKANAEQNLQNAKELFESNLQNVFENKGDDWELERLGDVCSFHNGKAHEKSIDENGKYKVVNSKFVSSNGKKAKRTAIAKFPLLKEDIVMVMSDVPNGKTLAKCFFIDKDDEYSLNQRVCAFRTTSFDKDFLFYQLNRNKYFLAFNNGENQSNLRKGDILDCPLLVPPLTRQKQIVQKLDALSAKTKKLEAIYTQKIADLEEMKKSVLQKAFSGQLNTIN
jgi:type I restriction enzyme, S subunit